MTVYERLKKAYSLGRGIRLLASDVEELMMNTAIRDAVYSSHDEFVRDTNGNEANGVPEIEPRSGEGA